ncbi:hypothetical protein BJ912DRAFT_1087135 [Pholiota molesta]|nr:hypothetical protein BJ912DRAFT_1087135 [Pholiota molesta]
MFRAHRGRAVNSAPIENLLQAHSLVPTQTNAAILQNNPGLRRWAKKIRWIKVSLYITFLYEILVWSFHVLLPIPGYIAKRTQDVQQMRMKMADARIQDVTEAVNVLRMIKLFGWEGKIAARIKEKKKSESRSLTLGIANASTSRNAASLAAILSGLKECVATNSLHILSLAATEHRRAHMRRPTWTEAAVKKERRKRVNGSKRKDEDSVERTKSMNERGPSGSFKLSQPLLTSATPWPPSRPVDEDYDEGVADALIGLASGGYRDNVAGVDGPSHLPSVSSHSRLSDPSPRPPPSHRNSVSSNHASPPPLAAAAVAVAAQVPGLGEQQAHARGLDEAPEHLAHRCLWQAHTPTALDALDTALAHSVPHAACIALARSTRPVPSKPFIPFPRIRANGARAPSGHTQQEQQQQHASYDASIALPLIATLSPESASPSPNHAERDDIMQVHRSLSSTSSRAKLSEVMHPASGLEVTEGQAVAVTIAAVAGEEGAHVVLIAVA